MTSSRSAHTGLSRLAAAILSLGCALSAHGAELWYSYLDASYLSGDDIDAGAAFGSWQYHRNARLFGSLSYDKEGDVKVTTASLGTGWIARPSDRVNVTADIGFTNVRVDVGDFDSSEQGAVAAVTGRFWIAPDFEVGVSAGVNHLFDVDSTVLSYGANMRYWFAPRAAFQFGISSTDETDAVLAVGLRFGSQQN
ncbi:MAG: hypothetical protein AAF515_23180 [Pseudomonadota bacterium]